LIGQIFETASYILETEIFCIENVILVIKKS